MNESDKYEAKLAASREYQRARYQNDPDWREKIKECNRQYYARKKAESGDLPKKPRGRPRIKGCGGQGSEARASESEEITPALKDN